MSVLSRLDTHPERPACASPRGAWLLLERAATLLFGATAMMFAITGLHYVAAFGWRQPMFDQYRQYLPLLELPFPHNLTYLENGHRPVIPNVLRLIDLREADGNQALLLWSGLCFIALSAGLVIWAALRERALLPSARAAAATLVCVALCWLGNARMMLHGSEAVQVYLAALMVVMAALFTHRAVLCERLFPAVWAGICCMVAAFSFGSGIAAFPAVIVLALVMHARKRVVALFLANLGIALLLYVVVLHGDDGVRQSIALQPLHSLRFAAQWLAGPWSNAWLGLAQPVGGDWLRVESMNFGGGLLVASAEMLDRQLGREAILGGFSVVLGGMGIAALLFLLWRRWRAKTPLGALGAVAVTLALFGAGTALLIGIVRADYFAQQPLQVSAERYGVWPGLFWLGLGLLLIEATGHGHKPWRLGAVLGLSLLVAALAWPTHLAWRGWGVAMYRIAETGAASLRAGTPDATRLPSHAEVEPAKLQRVAALLRAQRLVMFRDEPAQWLGRTPPWPLAPAPTAPLANTRMERAAVESGEDVGVMVFSGRLLDLNLRETLGALLVLDDAGLVVGYAQWSHDPELGRNAWVYAPRMGGFDGYARLPHPCAPLTLAAVDDVAKRILPLASLPSCAATL